ncbi:unnamed protein product [Prorocentrum cordatum]|uniref:Uncharacterized protein n=1 Tax=Prorocentrum cordatum TaxID=2364126 RepID=A0ABN9SDJ6_9DINO|nr:unnamed protein product [Polarella glacialis]
MDRVMESFGNRLHDTVERLFKDMLKTPGTLLTLSGESVQTAMNANFVARDTLGAVTNKVMETMLRSFQTNLLQHHAKSTIVIEESATMMGMQTSPLHHDLETKMATLEAQLERPEERHLKELDRGKRTRPPRAPSTTMTSASKTCSRDPSPRSPASLPVCHFPGRPALRHCGAHMLFLSYLAAACGVLTDDDYGF